MLSIKEIDKEFTELVAAMQAYADEAGLNIKIKEGATLKKIKNQAKDYVSLVEKIEGMEPKIDSKYSPGNIGWNKCLVKIESFIDES